MLHLRYCWDTDPSIYTAWLSDRIRRVKRDKQSLNWDLGIMHGYIYLLQHSCFIQALFVWLIAPLAARARSSLVEQALVRGARGIQPSRR